MKTIKERIKDYVEILVEHAPEEVLLPLHNTLIEELNRLYLQHYIK